MQCTSIVNVESESGGQYKVQDWKRGVEWERDGGNRWQHMDVWNFISQLLVHIPHLLLCMLVVVVSCYHPLATHTVPPLWRTLWTSTIFLTTGTLRTCRRGPKLISTCTGTITTSAEEVLSSTSRLVVSIYRSGTMSLLLAHSWCMGKI